MSPDRDQRWPDGGDSDNPILAELRAALDEAALRGPDDMTLRRGWTAVAAPQPPARARRWPWFASGVVTTAAMIAVTAVWLWPRAADVVARSLGRMRGNAGASVAAGGVRRVTLEGGVEAQLGAASVMRIDDGAPRVERGEVRFSVPHRAPGHPFVVRTETYSVVVVGTKFGVSVQAEDVKVDVDEGVVEVWRTATQTRVARLIPGDVWRSAEDTAAAVPPLVANTGIARASAASFPGRPDTGAGNDVGPQRRAERARPTHASFRASRRLALATPGSGATTHPAVATTTAAAATDDSTIAAREALAEGDPARALQIYRAAALRTGPAAENAAYAVGKVLNEKMNQPTAAVAAWRRYRTDYPDGILRVEADLSIVETLARIGEIDDALGEANEFLRRHPDSERRAEIARLAGDLYRARGDCRRAVSAYQIVLGASRPRDIVEIASFHRAACLVHLGDASGGDAARAYLRGYPDGRFRTEAAALLGNGSGGDDRVARP